jgi:hypothetical protein
MPFVSVFSPEGAVGQTQVWMPTYVNIQHSYGGVGIEEVYLLLIYDNGTRWG